MNVQSKQVSLGSINGEFKNRASINKKTAASEAFEGLLVTVGKEDLSSGSFIGNNNSVMLNLQNELDSSLDRDILDDQEVESTVPNNSLLFLNKLIPEINIAQKTGNNQLLEDMKQVLAVIDNSLEGRILMKNGNLISGNEITGQVQTISFNEEFTKIEMLIARSMSKLLENNEEIPADVQHLLKEMKLAVDHISTTDKTDIKLIGDTLRELIANMDHKDNKVIKTEARLIDSLKQMKPDSISHPTSLALQTSILNEVELERNSSSLMLRDVLREALISNKLLQDQHAIQQTERDSPEGQSSEEPVSIQLDYADKLQEQVKQTENQEQINIDERQPINEELVKEEPKVDNQLDLMEFPKSTTKEQQTLSTSKQPDVLVRLSQLPKDFSELINQRLQVMKTGEDSQIRIKLAPDHLGQLDIRLSTTDGKITAQITTLAPGTKEIIESQIHQLRQTLLNQGIQLDKFDVIQQPQPSSQASLMQDGRSQQGQQFDQRKNRESNQKGEYDVEENVLLTQGVEDKVSAGINYSV